MTTSDQNDSFGFTLVSNAPHPGARVRAWKGSRVLVGGADTVEGAAGLGLTMMADLETGNLTGYFAQWDFATREPNG